MKRTYLGAVCGSEGSFGIVFLDLPGCTSESDTVGGVLGSGAEALHGHISAMLDAGDAIPEPSVHTLADVEAWLAEDSGPTGETWVILSPISIDMADTREFVTVRMRADLVQQIADTAELSARRLSSQRFIEQAVEHEIDRYRKSAA